MGLMDSFLHPTQKLQEVESWNQQPSSRFLPKLKMERVKLKSEETKSKPDASSLSLGSSNIGEINPRKGRGRGLRRMGQLLSLRGKRRHFCCSYCDYGSVRRYNTERHIRLRHPSYRFKCPLEHCGQILLDDMELRLHLQGHSGAAFFLQCRDCGVPCRDYDSLVSHQNSCGAIQGGDVAAEGQVEPEKQDSAREDAVIDSVGEDVPIDDHVRDSDGHVVTRLSTKNNEDVTEGQEGKPSPGNAEHDSESDDDNSVEVVDDDNLPVHFMVKEEMESPSSSS